MSETRGKLLGCFGEEGVNSELLFFFLLLVVLFCYPSFGCRY
ncbi:hypothetical protein [Senegalia massiliensis]|jgi:hypothetical protein|nr:hypothetical protein [Senegalia massiliensis]